MSPTPIDPAKVVLHTLRALEEGRRSVSEQLDSLTRGVSEALKPAPDRRRPPQIW